MVSKKSARKNARKAAIEIHRSKHIPKSKRAAAAKGREGWRQSVTDTIKKTKERMKKMAGGTIAPGTPIYGQRVARGLPVVKAPHPKSKSPGKPNTKGVKGRKTDSRLTTKAPSASKARSGVRSKGAVKSSRRDQGKK